MIDVIKELEGFCSPEHLEIVKKLPPLNQATEVKTYRNKAALEIAVNKFIYDREIILKDINYVYSSPQAEDTDFIVIYLNGVFRAFENAERVSIVKVFERRGC